ncbi:MAG: hypothetical protein ABGZ35_19520 [Planctomycetaceae bacterium]
MAETAVEEQVVLCERHGQHLSITGEDLSRLHCDLVVRRNLTTVGGPHGYDVKPQNESLLIHPDGYWIPNAGCLDALRYKAAQSGLELRVSATTPIVQLPDPQNVDQLPHPALADFVHANERGLIFAAGSVELGLIIAELAAAYPALRIIVVCDSVITLRKVEKTVRKIMSADDTRASQIAVVHDKERLQIVDDEPMPRIILTTPVATADLDLATGDIVALVDATDCTQQRFQRALETMDASFRLFGILDPTRKLTHYESGKVRATFGFDQIDLMSCRRVRRDVQVAWVHHFGQQRNHSEAEASFDYGRDIIRNGHRNDTVARTAKALSAGRQITGGHRRDIRKWTDSHGPGPLRVTILVDRPEHAIELNRLLPDCFVTFGPDTDLRGVSRKTADLLGPRLRRPGLISIAVAEAARGFKGWGSDVVIWAGAGTSAAAIPPSWMFSWERVARPMLIVDFQDRFSGQVRKWSHQRRQAYAARDIYGVDECPKVRRIERFLKDHVRDHGRHRGGTPA